MASVSSISMHSPIPQRIICATGHYSPAMSHLSKREYCYLNVQALHRRSQDSPSSGLAPSNAIISLSRRFIIARYYSLEAKAGSPIVVTVDFQHQSQNTMFLRLVLGRRPLTTSVCHVPESRYGSWELKAVVPPPEDFTNPSASIPVHVQALDGANSVIDSAEAGSFTYIIPPGLYYSGLPPIKHSSSSESLKSMTGTSAKAFGSRLRRPVSRSPSSRSRNAKAASINLRTTHSPKQKSIFLERVRRFNPGEEIPESQRIALDIASPVESMAADWTEEEARLGRRLVLFQGLLEGQKLTVTCERIRQEEYTDGDAVVSCIFRKDTNGCYITSVDIISLLENLANKPFPIEEKNRIRRNLEGFRPKTISKNRSGTEDFFQQIMDFPTPKPRNIEKDVKVFDWDILPQALEKILSKYGPSSFNRNTAADSVGATSSYQAQHSSSPDMLPAMMPSHSSSPYGSDRMTVSTSSFHYTSDDGYSSPILHNHDFSHQNAGPYYMRSDAMASYSSLVESPASGSSLSGTPSPRSHASFVDDQSDPHIFTPDMQHLFPSNPIPRSASLTVSSTAPSDGIVFEDDFSSLSSDCQPFLQGHQNASIASFSI